MSAPGTTSRRSVLLGAGRGVLAVVVAGSVGACTSTPEANPPPPPDPDDALREATADRERALLGLYDAALLAAPQLAALLAPLRAHHEVHLAAVTDPAAAIPSPTASVAAASPSPSPLPPLPPGDARAALAEAERTAGAAHAADALAARDNSLAALLASLSASEQSHPVALA